MKKLKELLIEKNNQKIVMVLGIISAVLIMLGVTYAFFTYSRNGSTENTIKSGSVTFLYDEINQSGNSIGITDALPISDTDGKAGTNAFNFRIVSNTATNMAIPYEIALRQKSGTDNIGDKIKVYLSKTSGYEAPVNTEDEVITSLFSSLPNTTHNGYSEKTLHTDEVPQQSTNYIQNYRLKMWLDESVDLSNESYNGKTFTVMVNVYANGRIASSNANIESVAVNNSVLTAVNANEYETTLEPETTQATVRVEAEDDNSTVDITKTESDYTTPVTINNSIQRLSKTLNRTVNLTEGDNYFRIIVTSENNKNSKEQHLKITVESSTTVLKGLAKMIYDNNTIITTTPDFHKHDPEVVSFTDNGVDNNRVFKYTRNSTSSNYYITYGDGYTFDSSTGKYSLVNPQVCKYKDCYTSLRGKYVASATAANKSGNIAAWKNHPRYHKILSTSDASITYYVATTKTANFNAGNPGLYSMNVVNGYGGKSREETTYYFRGNVTNNYVIFEKWKSDLYYGYSDDGEKSHGFVSLNQCQSDSTYNNYCEKKHSAGDDMMWRIVRINEDGTVRLILEDSADGNPYAFKTDRDRFEYSYYSNSNIKNEIDTWYTNNITGANAFKVATGNYFCEAAKVGYTTSTKNVGDVVLTIYSSYEPNLECQQDSNGYGMINSQVGLLTYDELVMAGDIYDGGQTTFNNYYLTQDYNYWLMSPAGSNNSSTTVVWTGSKNGTSNGGCGVTCDGVTTKAVEIRPVINLKAAVTATGSGTASDPYVIQ